MGSEDDSQRQDPSSTEFTFGKYQVLEELGRGGMGVVYRARQQDLDRTVALKMILANHLASPEQVQRFHAEAQAAAKARHPGVVGVYETGTIQGQHYIAMEYIDGPSLDAWMAQRGHDPMEAARLVAVIARAVAYLHSLGIVHRDLKPSNILLDHDGKPHVTDFGLAKVRGGAGTGLSVTGALIGTPGYMAPEQISGNGEPGPRSDVYSLGAILYECCTGQHPFQADTPVAVLMRVLEGEPQRPRRVAPAMPRALETVCLKCLEKSPEERYASAAKLARDLERILAGEPVEAGKPGLPHRLRRWVRRRPALAARLFAFLVFYGTSIVNYCTGKTDAEFFQGFSVLLAIWTSVSLVFHGMVSRGRWPPAVRYAWATTDVTLFTAILLLGKGLESQMLIIYPLLIAAAGLWSRVKLVYFMTAAVLASYALLALLTIDATRETPSDLVAQRRIFGAAMVVLGLMVGYQVRRARNLSRLMSRQLRAR